MRRSIFFVEFQAKDQTDGFVNQALDEIVLGGRVVAVFLLWTPRQVKHGRHLVGEIWRLVPPPSRTVETALVLRGEGNIRTTEASPCGSPAAPLKPTNLMQCSDWRPDHT